MDEGAVEGTGRMMDDSLPPTSTFLNPILLSIPSQAPTTSHIPPIHPLPGPHHLPHPSLPPPIPLPLHHLTHTLCLFPSLFLPYPTYPPNSPYPTSSLLLLSPPVPPLPHTQKIPYPFYCSLVLYLP
ncbi:hypothetical protein Pcinc_029422 [Petrolisthes cinctipes]|uniref:Uncharacterized protein n=1 Tax=Petrolisthes cinctipes TaxID=88211 RepID=A0AAE1F1F6_PETCI|nr:hypothetical protein Pcinc_029422 [Petrolisthes cinctipes]